MPLTNSIELKKVLVAILTSKSSKVNSLISGRNLMYGERLTNEEKKIKINSKNTPSLSLMPSIKQRRTSLMITNESQRLAIILMTLPTPLDSQSRMKRL